MKIKTATRRMAFLRSFPIHWIRRNTRDGKTSRNLASYRRSLKRIDARRSRRLAPAFIAESLDDGLAMDWNQAREQREAWRDERRSQDRMEADWIIDHADYEVRSWYGDLESIESDSCDCGYCRSVAEYRHADDPNRWDDFDGWNPDDDGDDVPDFYRDPLEPDPDAWDPYGEPDTIAWQSFPPESHRFDDEPATIQEWADRKGARNRSRSDH